MQPFAKTSTRFALRNSRARWLFTLGALLPACSGTPVEPPSKAPAAVVYMEWTLGTPVKRILELDLDSTVPRVVYRPPAGEDLGEMTLSPDGHTILFSAYDGSPEDAYEWRTMPLAGGAWTPFPTPPDVFLATWSPLGDAIAWRINGGNSLGVAAAGATTFTGLTAPDFEVLSEGSWSPDGSRLVVSVYTEESETQPYLATVTGDLTPLLVSNGTAGTPSWSLATNMIAFMRYDEDSGETGLYIVAPDGSSLRRIAAGQFGGPVFWSRDGAMIATYLRDPVNDLEPVVVSVLTGHVTHLKPSAARFPYRSDPWSPDDSQLLLSLPIVLGLQRFEVLLVTDLQGHYRQVTPDSLHAAQPVWVP